MKNKKAKLTVFFFLFFFIKSYSQKIDIYYNGFFLKLTDSHTKLYQIDEAKAKKLLKFDNYNKLIESDSINGVGLELKYKNKIYKFPFFTDKNERLMSSLSIYIKETNIPLIYNFKNIAIEFEGSTFFINEKKIIGIQKQVRKEYPYKIEIEKKQDELKTYKINGIKDFKRHFEKTSCELRNKSWFEKLPEGGHKSFYIEIPNILCNANCGNLSETSLGYEFGTFGCLDSLDIRVHIDVNYSAIKDDSNIGFMGEETRHDSIDKKNNRHYFYGKLENGNFWKVYIIDNFTISYYNVPKEMKAFFDYSIDSFRFKRKK